MNAKEYLKLKLTDTPDNNRLLGVSNRSIIEGFMEAYADHKSDDPCSSCRYGPERCRICDICSEGLSSQWKPKEANTDTVEHFNAIDEYATSNLNPDMFKEWCKIVCYWSDYMEDLKGCKKNYHVPIINE